MRAQIQAQIDALNKLADVLHHKCENLIAADVESIADNLEAATRPQWVPVAERLPDSSRDVWVFADGDIFRAIHNHWEWVDIMDNQLVEQPTHWHEIEYPEPPEVQQQ